MCVKPRPKRYMLEKDKARGLKDEQIREPTKISDQYAVAITNAVAAVN